MIVELLGQPDDPDLDTVHVDGIAVELVTQDDKLRIDMVSRYEGTEAQREILADTVTDSPESRSLYSRFMIGLVAMCDFVNTIPDAGAVKSMVTMLDTLGSLVRMNQQVANPRYVHVAANAEQTFEHYYLDKNTGNYLRVVRDLGAESLSPAQMQEMITEELETQARENLSYEDQLDDLDEGSPEAM